MKKNKFFNVFLVASLGVAALLAASACGGDDQASSSKIPEEKSEYLVNGFNSLDDLYATKFIGVLPTDTMRMHINGMKEFISEGQGSLIYENLQGSYHEAFMLFENSSAPEIDARHISSLSVDVYNPNESGINLALLMKTENGGTLFFERAEIQAGEWKSVCIDLTGYSYAQKELIKGVSLRFDVNEPATFYVDNMVAKMGAEDLPPVDVNEVIDGLAAPAGVEKITQDNFDNHVAFVEKTFYAQSLYNALENKASVSGDKKAKLDACLAMVADFGVLYDSRTQFISRGDYGVSLTAISTEDEIYGGVWSMNVPSAKNEQGVGHQAINVDGYGKVFYWLYNPMDVNLNASFYGGWGSWDLKKVQLAAKSWTKIELNARWFEYDRIGQVYFIIYGAPTIDGEFKMTSMYGLSAKVVAQPIIDRINALPALNSLTYQDKETVMEIKAGYGNLSASAKAAVVNAETLADCERKIYEIEAAPVIEMIDALPDAQAITSAHAAAVTAAKAAYNALSSEAKAIIPEEKTVKLTELANLLKTAVVREAINALSDANAVSLPKDVTIIQEAKALFDALTDAEKEQIPTHEKDKLDACLAAIEGIDIVFDARNAQLCLNTNTGATSTATGGVKDSQFGDVFRMDVVAAGHGQADFFPNVDFTGYDKICFYIYNPTDLALNLVWYTVDWKNETGNWIALAPKTWTKIEVGAFYSENNGFYLIDKLAGEGKYNGWLITSFYGLAEGVEMPNPNNVNTPENPDMPENPDSNVLLDASDKSLLLAGRDTGNSGIVGTQKDETYGDVWTIDVPSDSITAGQGDFHAKSLESKGYKYATFYIYNPADVDVILVCYKVNWTHVDNTTMKANAWTAITVDLEKAGSDFFFIINSNVKAGTWKVTSFIGANEPLVNG